MALHISLLSDRASDTSALAGQIPFTLVVHVCSHACHRVCGHACHRACSHACRDGRQECHQTMSYLLDLVDVLCMTITWNIDAGVWLWCGYVVSWFIALMQMQRMPLYEIHYLGSSIQRGEVGEKALQCSDNVRRNVTFKCKI